MKVRIEYAGQLRTFARAAANELRCEPGTSLPAFIRALAHEAGEPVNRFLVDEHGEPRRSLVVAVNGSHVVLNDGVPLGDGDVVTLLSPVAGG